MCLRPSGKARFPCSWFFASLSVHGLHFTVYAPLTERCRRTLSGNVRCKSLVEPISYRPRRLTRTNCENKERVPKKRTPVNPECTKIARFSAVAAAIFTAPPQNRAIFKAPRCAISFAKKIASERRFSLRLKGANFDSHCGIPCDT